MDKAAQSGAPHDAEGAYRLVVEAITDYAIYMLDPAGYVSSWNPGAQRFKGYRAEEIVGQHFSKFYTEEDRAAGLAEYGLRTAAAVGRFENEGWRVRKDGTRFWAHVVIGAIRDNAGRLIGFAKITRDISERREAQRALETAREALFQSQKMEAIGQLTGGIAHDFNNLLMAVHGSLELLRKRMPADPKLLALIDNAIQGAERGGALTQRMLAFARKQELKLDRVDLAELMRAMTGLLDRSLGPGVAVRLRFPEDLPPVTADPNQIETALLNLAINARDAMNGEGVITISAEPHTVGANTHAGLAAGDYVCLCVVDTGEGMDEETLARAVEPFFTTKGVGKGTGLGLPMVQGVAAQSGGRLILKSRKGEGLSAELWLPVAVGEVLRPAAAPLPAFGIAGPLAILVVDDDDLVRTNTAAMLEDLGHTVIEAESGEAALEVLGSGRPVELIVTDQAMPRMTGVQLAHVARTKWPGLPVLLVTGYAELAPGEESDLPRLAKPFLQKDLARAIACLAGLKAPVSVG